jgi:hypothetical protein
VDDQMNADHQFVGPCFDLDFAEEALIGFIVIV